MPQHAPQRGRDQFPRDLSAARVPVPICVPDFDRTIKASPLLMAPSRFTSERKLVPSLNSPERLRVCCASPEFTALSPVVSPSRTSIDAEMLGTVAPSAATAL